MQRQAGAGLLYPHRLLCVKMPALPAPSRCWGWMRRNWAWSRPGENARLNGLEDRVQFVCADVFDLLPELEKKGESFDVVILDPPAFTK